MKLQTFNGGLQTRLKPNLIDLAAGVEYTNIDSEAGVLTASKDKDATGIFVDAYFTKFLATGEWVSKAQPTEFVEYQRKLYWTGSPCQKYDGTNTWRLGIVKPATKVAATPVKLSPPTDFTLTEETAGTLTTLTETTGDFPADVYWYKVVYYTSDGVARIENTISIVIATTGSVAGVQITCPDKLFPGGKIEVYRLYSGAMYLVTTFTTASATVIDSTLDISANPVLSALPNSEDLPDDTTYTYYLVNHSAGYRSTKLTRSLTTSTLRNRYKIIRIDGFEGFDGTTRLYRLDDTTGKIHELAVVTPISKYFDTEPDISTLPEITDIEAALNGTYQYTVTYYNSADGTESQPSPLSAETTVTGRIELTDIPVSADPQVDKKIVYRLGGELTNFAKVVELDNAATAFTDLVSDINIPGAILDTSTNGVPPDGLRHLLTAYGELFGVLDNKLYFTRGVGNFNYWPETNYLQFPLPLTGLGLTANGLLVFDKYNTYLVTGTSPATFVQYPLSKDQGCVDGRSIANYGGAVLFASTDGICACSGGEVKVISKAALGNIKLTAVSATVYDEVYYLHQSDGTILAADFRYGLIFKKYVLGTSSIANIDDTLYGHYNGELYSLFTNPNRLAYTYKSPNIIEGAFTNHKLYNNLYLRSEGAYTLEVFIDGVSVLTTDIASDGTQDISIPQPVQRGYSIQFAITGTGTVYEIEYKTVGRQNGR